MSVSDPDDVLPWLSKVRHDLLAIANNIAAEETPWDVVCFHAQQAAEKALKAFLVAHGTTPARTHDCVRLLQDCLPHDDCLADLREACADLTSHAVFSRYPGELYEPDEAAGLEMTAKGRQVVAAIVARLGLAFDDPLDDSRDEKAPGEPEEQAKGEDEARSVGEDDEA